ncbi:unnamed protein product, partial [Cylicocyclus nassatus]
RCVFSTSPPSCRTRSSSSKRTAETDFCSLSITHTLRTIRLLQRATIHQMFFQTEGNRALFHYIIGITSFVVLLLFCCTLQCFVCRRLRRKRRYDENFEPLHYPSSTLQFVRFSHNRREQQKMNATTFDIPCNDQK